MARQYNTIGFSPVVKTKQANYPEIAKQMTDTINQQAASGWNFHSYESVPVLVKSGCIGFGVKTTVIYHMLVFYRDI